MMATGKAYLDLRQALADLGISDAEAQALGLRIYKVALTWPLEESATLDSLPEGEMQTLVDSALGYDEEIRQSGHYIVSNALQRARTARTIRVRGGKVDHHRRPLRRDEGAARRLLPHRGQGPRRGVRGRLAVPAGPPRDHRGAPGPGAAALLAAAPTGMSEPTVDRAREAVDAVYRAESRRVLATLIRLLGDFDLAEEALHEAFAAAVEQWPREGVPANPRAWLVSAGRFKAIDAMRRRARFDASPAELAERLEAETADAAAAATARTSRTTGCG